MADTAAPRVRLRDVDALTVFNILMVVGAFYAFTWFGGGASLVRKGAAAGSGYGAVLVATGLLLCAFVPLVVVLAVRRARPQATALQRSTGKIDVWTPWWCWLLWLAGIAVAAAWLAGGAVVLHNGARGIIAAFDDPDLSAQCSTAVRTHCLSTSRSVVTRTNDDYGTTLSVTSDDRRIYLHLVARELPEDGTVVDLESVDGVLVSVRAADGGRRWHTASWPRHWRTVARSLAVIAAGFLLLGTFAGIFTWGFVSRARLRAQLRQ